MSKLSLSIFLLSLCLVTSCGSKEQKDFMAKIQADSKSDEIERNNETKRINLERKRAIDEAKNQGLPIAITHCAAMAPNSSGGVDVIIDILNTSNRIIKYVYPQVRPFNRVKDPVVSTIGNKSKATLSIVGPIDPNVLASYDKDYSFSLPPHFENVWWNSSIDSIQLDSVKVVFMDDSTETLSGSDLKQIFVNKFDSCWVE